MARRLAYFLFGSLLAIVAARPAHAQGWDNGWNGGWNNGGWNNNGWNNGGWNNNGWNGGGWNNNGWNGGGWNNGGWNNGGWNNNGWNGGGWNNGGWNGGGWNNGGWNGGGWNGGGWVNAAPRGGYVPMYPGDMFGANLGDQVYGGTHIPGQGVVNGTLPARPSGFSGNVPYNPGGGVFPGNGQYAPGMPGNRR